MINIPQVLTKARDKICNHALAGFLPILTSLAHGVAFEEVGIEHGNKGALHCIKPYGGVLFEVEKKEA